MKREATDDLPRASRRSQRTAVSSDPDVSLRPVNCDATVEASGDLQLTVESPDDPEINCHHVVSKALIYNASSVLRRKFQLALGRREKAATSTDSSQSVSRLVVKGDPEAFNIFIWIVSCKNDRVPRKLDQPKLLKLAALTVKYDLCNCLGGWPALWIKQYQDEMAGTRRSRGSLTDWLSICFAFKLADLFRHYSREKVLATSIARNIESGGEGMIVYTNVECLLPSNIMGKTDC